MDKDSYLSFNQFHKRKILNEPTVMVRNKCMLTRFQD